MRPKQVADAGGDWTELAPNLPLLAYVVATDGSTSVTYASRAIAERLGCSVEELSGVWRLLHPDDRERVLRDRARALEDGGPVSSEYRLVARDGRVVWIHDECAGGDAAGLRGHCLDITAHKDTELRLQASDEQFRAVVANIPGVVYRCGCDANWTMRFISDDVEALVGYPASDFVDNRVRSYGSLIHCEDRPTVVKRVEQALERGCPYSLQYRLVHADGSYRWIAEHGKAVIGGKGQSSWLDGVILDISQQKLAEQARDLAKAQLQAQSELNRHQALHDSLTDLPNRTLFHDRVGQAVFAAERDGTEFAMLLLDLDRFKEVNDTLGHACGDRLLGAVAERLRGVVRNVDSIARLGGDEFACLVTGSSADAAIEVAERIRAALCEPYVLQDLPVQIETSIGIAIYPHHGCDCDALLQCADVAMYAAKEAGSGQAVYVPSERPRPPQMVTLISELRRAIDLHELCLQYQPKMEVRSGHVAGVEALVRWRHPVRGMLAPDQFVPLAQQTGLMRPLTLCVIEQALRQCKKWQQRGHELTVSVNVSIRNLIDAGFPDDVSQLLEKCQLRPDLLELEITEAAIMADPFRTKVVLEELAAIGVRLSVDDFGTGDTSLAYLSRLPIHEIKIHRSFVHAMTRSIDDAVIVRAAIDLGRNLGLEVVAEGVESSEEWAQLASLGCSTAQGYYMSRAVDPDELTAWLERLTPSYQPQSSEPILAEPASTAPVIVGHGALSVEDIVAVAVRGDRVVLDPAVHRRMNNSRRLIERALTDGESVYGLTTGVGPQKTVAVAAGEQANFNRLMILAHCVGHGEQVPAAFIRAAMLIRGEGLALGAAGVRPVIVEALLNALNANAIPRVHAIGSIGQGDLSPLAEIARALIGEGPDAGLIERAGLHPLRLAAREALALVSSNAFSLGIAALALHRARAALRALELAAALAFEGFAANVSAVDPAVAKLRPHDGIEQTIANMRALLAGGALLAGARPPQNLQDPLCFRVLPQTHSASHHALAQLQKVVETELRSAADNPAVIVGSNRILANGNHDITPIAVALDYARLGVAQAVTIANERIQKLLDSSFSGLPSGLRARDDISDDGLAAVGHGSTALAAEARLLAAPVTLEHTTSAAAEGIEDRISMAPLAARRLHEMAGHATRLAAVELICSAQAVDLRHAAGELGRGTTNAYHAVRSLIPYVGPGQAPPDDLEPLVEWLDTRECPRNLWT